MKNKITNLVKFRRLVSVPIWFNNRNINVNLINVQVQWNLRRLISHDIDLYPFLHECLCQPITIETGPYARYSTKIEPLQIFNIDSKLSNN